ncbi:unnamed protein product [Camellia sinensis]
MFLYKYKDWEVIWSTISSFIFLLSSHNRLLYRDPLLWFPTLLSLFKISYLIFQQVNTHIINAERGLSRASRPLLSILLLNNLSIYNYGKL